jgi:hypothetical protein
MIIRMRSRWAGVVVGVLDGLLWGTLVFVWLVEPAQ